MRWSNEAPATQLLSRSAKTEKSLCSSRLNEAKYKYLTLNTHTHTHTHTQTGDKDVFANSLLPLLVFSSVSFYN